MLLKKPSGAVVQWTGAVGVVVGRVGFASGTGFVLAKRILVAMVGAFHLPACAAVERTGRIGGSAATRREDSQVSTEFRTMQNQEEKALAVGDPARPSGPSRRADYLRKTSDAVATISTSLAADMRETADELDRLTLAQSTSDAERVALQASMDELVRVHKEHVGWLRGELDKLTADLATARSEREQAEKQRDYFEASQASVVQQLDVLYAGRKAAEARADAAERALGAIRGHVEQLIGFSVNQLDDMLQQDAQGWLVSRHDVLALLPPPVPEGS